VQRSSACLATSNRAVSASGASIQATRKPGARVFEKLLRYTTRPSVSSARIGRTSASPGDILEVEIPVRVVLDDQDVAPPGPFEQGRGASRATAAARSDSGNSAPRRGRERGGHRAQAFVDAIQILEVDPVGLLAYAFHERAHIAERGDGAGVSGQLDEDTCRRDRAARARPGRAPAASRSSPAAARDRSGPRGGS
jgi:hypothetical protein